MKIEFEQNTVYGMYRDALHFADGEPLPSDEAIEAMKQERVNNWIKIVETPPLPPDEAIADG